MLTSSTLLSVNLLYRIAHVFHKCADFCTMGVRRVIEFDSNEPIITVGGPHLSMCARYRMGIHVKGEMFYSR